MSSHQESTITENGVTFKVVTDITVTGDTTHVCPTGQHWDNTLQQCVNNERPCPPGEHWDPVMGKCVGDIPAPDPGLPPADGWFEQLDKNANKDPTTWKVVPMTKDPALSKVVDNNNVNRAVEFKSNVSAQQYVDHFIWLKNNPSTPPPTHTCPTGQHWDDAQQKCVDDTTAPPPTTGDKDVEGIQKIYVDDPSKSDQQFFVHKDGNTSSRLGGKGTRVVLADGSIKISPTSSTHPATARIYIKTTDGSFDYNAQLAAGGNDWNKMLNRADKDGVKRGGWMMTNNDFRDVEATHYYKIPKINVDDEMTNYVGGGHPSDDQYPLQCISSAYKAQLQTKDCSSRAAIEWDHFASPGNYAWNDQGKEQFDLKAALGGTMQNKVIGQKYVRWNEIAADGTLKAVHQELYVDLESKDLPKPDLSKQRWQFYVEFVHDGTNWPSDPKSTGFIKGCNGGGVTMPAWGAPVYGMRFDESDWIMYNLSVRPILPKKATA